MGDLTRWECSHVPYCAVVRDVIHPQSLLVGETKISGRGFPDDQVSCMGERKARDADARAVFRGLLRLGSKSEASCRSKAVRFFRLKASCDTQATLHAKLPKPWTSRNFSDLQICM